MEIYFSKFVTHNTEIPMQYYSGNIVDIVNKRIFKGRILVENQQIVKITEEDVTENQYLLPGLIDAHIHIESSMLTPVEFARLASPHGTVATVSDPHEIANVLGIEGIKFMIQNGKKVPFKFFFGAPSCVPATGFESSGAKIGVAETEELLRMKDIKYLAEMMNFPGVLYGDQEVADKLALAKKYNKPVDGHAPGVFGLDAKKYIDAGISTDHECFSMDEALEKIKYGMKILIREGSAAKNFETLADLLRTNPDDIMLCSDDKHPNDLAEGHINELIKRALAKGFDPITVLRSCIYNPIKHYNLEVGMLQKGDAADFIIVDNLNDFNVLETYIDGIKVAEKGSTLLQSVLEITPNKFNISSLYLEDLQVIPQEGKMQVMEAMEGELITNRILVQPKVENGFVVSDTDRDILKIVVLNRYQNNAKPAIGFIKNFGLKEGALASTVAHDSHNIIAVGVSDEDIFKAITLLIQNKGGISCIRKTNEYCLPLPVGGIMSNDDGLGVAKDYEMLDLAAKKLGTQLKAPYMTLSFMALLVIPDLKLGDKGLFDGTKFKFTNLFVK